MSSSPKANSPLRKFQKSSRRVSQVLSAKHVARRLSMAVLNKGRRSPTDHPVGEDEIKKQNFITDVHLEKKVENDPVDDIVEALCNSDYLEQLTQIFQYYSSYGDSYNLTSMKLSNYVKFIRKSQYLPTKYPLAQIQVLFKEALKKDVQQENKYNNRGTSSNNNKSPRNSIRSPTNSNTNNMGKIDDDNNNQLLSKRQRSTQLSFKGWLRCICLTVKAKNANNNNIVTKEKEANALPGIVENVISKYIIINSDRLEPLPSAEFLLDDKLVTILRNNTPTMMKIYNYYATPSRTIDDRLFLQQTGLRNVFNDFKIPQTIVSKLELFRIWTHVAHEHDLMEFPEFLEVMGRAAMLGYSKPFLNERHKTAESKLSGFLELFRYNEKLRLIIEENRQMGKQVYRHKMSTHQIMGKSKKRRFKRSPTSLHRLYHKFGASTTSNNNNNNNNKRTDSKNLLVLNHSKNKNQNTKMKGRIMRSVSEDGNGSSDDEMEIIQPPRLSELIKHSPPKYQRNQEQREKVHEIKDLKLVDDDNEEEEEEQRMKQAGKLTDAEKRFAAEWDKNSSHLMSSAVASSVFSPLWKPDKPLERAVRTLEPYESQLLEVFEYYCFLNNRHKLNFNRLDSFNWMKLLRDSKLMREGNDSYNGDEMEEEMHDLWISRAEADVIYVDLSTMEKPHGWINFDRFKLGLARVAHILEHRVGPGGLRHHKINEDRFNILNKKEKRLHDYPQIKSPIKKQFASPIQPRRASVHLTWQPTSPRKEDLKKKHILKKVTTESEADRAERLLDLIEDEEDSMCYIHMNQNYREQILDLADSLLIMVEQHVLKYASRVSCFGYGHEEADTAMEQLNEEQVVAVLKEQEMTLQRIFTYFSTRRHEKKPFWTPGEDRTKAISYVELEEITHSFNLTPSILTRSEIFMCFRASRRNPIEAPDILTYSEWVECFARMGLLAFSKPYLKKTHPLPEHRVHGFFGWLKASEGMNEIENLEWSRGHGYTGLKMTKAFLDGEEVYRKSKVTTNVKDHAEAHDLISHFNMTMSKIREHADKTRNSDGKLNLKKEFQEIDTDGSGTILIDEFVNFVHKLCKKEDASGSPITDDEIASLFRILDPDDNGFITYGEFTYQFYNRRSTVKKLRSDSIISSSSLSPTNLNQKFIEEEKETKSKNQKGTNGEDETNRRASSPKTGTARLSSVIQPFRPVKYTYEELFDIKNRLKIACKSWIGDTFADFPSLMMAKNSTAITLEEFQIGIDKISQGTDFNGRLTNEDVLAIYHLLTRDKTVDLSITNVIDFLEATDLMRFGIEKSSKKGNEKGEIEVKPFRKNTTKPTVASKHQRHPRRNDIIPVKRVAFGNDRIAEPPTMEEILGVLTDEDKLKSPIHNSHRPLSNGKAVTKKQNSSTKGNGTPSNQWVRKTSKNKSSPFSPYPSDNHSASVASIIERQTKVAAPKLFVRSPGEAKYLKRMRDATKERQRVSKLTSMRNSSPVKERKKKPKTSKIWRNIEKRGSFFGMYKGKVKGSTSNSIDIANGGKVVKTIKGGSSTNSHSNDTKQVSNGNRVNVARTTTSSANKKKKKTPKPKSPGTVRRFQF